MVRYPPTWLISVPVGNNVVEREQMMFYTIYLDLQGWYHLEMMLFNTLLTRRTCKANQNLAFVRAAVPFRNNVF